MIVCPGCGTKLEIDKEKRTVRITSNISGALLKSVTCPKCKEIIKNELGV